MSRRDPLWTWSGRAVFLLAGLGLAIYLYRVGLEKADKIASSLGAIFALCALLAPRLLPAAPASAAETSTDEPDHASDTGSATASAGGHANTGVQVDGGNRAARASRTGPASSQGPGSIANTGVTHHSNRPL